MFVRMCIFLIYAMFLALSNFSTLTLFNNLNHWSTWETTMNYKVIYITFHESLYNSRIAT